VAHGVGEPRLDREALGRIAVGEQLVCEHLDRDLGTDRGLNRPVDRPHAAAADALDDAVAVHHAADHGSPPVDVTGAPSSAHGPGVVLGSPQRVHTKARAGDEAVMEAPANRTRSAV
jgi:hypothetical protein